MLRSEPVRIQKGQTTLSAEPPLCLLVSAPNCPIRATVTEAACLSEHVIDASTPTWPRHPSAKWILCRVAVGLQLVCLGLHGEVRRVRSHGQVLVLLVLLGYLWLQDQQLAARQVTPSAVKLTARGIRGATRRVHMSLCDVRVN